MKSFGMTDKGLVRSYNEDHFFRSDKRIGNLPNLYVVADGMGGHNAGDIASKQAVAYMIKYIEEAEAVDVSVILTDAVLYANEMVYDEGRHNKALQGMGTTLVACVVEDGVAYIVNVGDSRLYVKQSELIQITVDHSVVEELFRAGHISEEEKMIHPDRNVITRAIGAEGTVAVDCFTSNMSDGDLIVMCSDGLNKMVEDTTIDAMLGTDKELSDIGADLIQGANDLGGNDNVTVVLVRYESEVAS